MEISRRLVSTWGAELSLGQLLRNAIDLILLWHERSRQRRALMSLDDRLLRDIGIDRLEADIEIRKPFWRA